MIAKQLPLVAFIIPCYNEENSIGAVIDEARVLVPDSMIYVCDNNSTDSTATVALSHGATVLKEPLKGKGNAVRRLLRDVEADIYVMTDGDNTYDLTHVPMAIQMIGKDCYDLLTGNRRLGLSASSFRKGHSVGNKLFTSLFKVLFNIQTDDVFSGLRVLSRRFVKSFPIISCEFEIETELTIYSAKMRLPMADFPTYVRPRVQSQSKLNAYKDGAKILLFALRILHREFPLRLYLPLSLISSLIATYFFSQVYFAFLLTGQVLKQPTLITSVFLYAASTIIFFSGFILKEISNIKYESRWIAYLRSSV